MRLTILIASLLLPLLFSCEKEDVYSSGLISKWEWESSSGGFAFATYTPKSTGENRTIEFTKDAVYRQYLNGALIIESKFHIVKSKSIFSLEDVDIIDYTETSTRQSYEIKDQDRLILYDEVYDGYENHYRRIK